MGTRRTRGKLFHITCKWMYDHQSAVPALVVIDDQTQIVPLLIRIISSVTLRQIAHSGIQSRHKTLVYIEEDVEFGKLAHTCLHLPQFLMPREKELDLVGVGNSHALCTECYPDTTQSVITLLQLSLQGQRCLLLVLDGLLLRFLHIIHSRNQYKLYMDDPIISDSNEAMMIDKEQGSVVIEPLAHPVIGETDASHLLLAEQVASVEDIGGLLHQLVELSIGVSFEDVPLRQDDNRMRLPYSLLCRWELLDESRVTLLPELVQFHLLYELNGNSSTCYREVLGSNICTCVPYQRRQWAISTAGDQRGSLVSFLKAVPKRVIFLPFRLKFSDWNTLRKKFFFLYSFSWMTASQQAATSSNPLISARQIKARISFLKQLPPKPTLQFKNLSPIRESAAMHLRTSCTSASYSSQSMAMLLMEETLCARKQLATSLDNSAEN